MDREALQKMREGQRWWQDWRWVAAIAFLIFSVGFSAFVWTTVRTQSVVQDAEPILAELNVLAEQNAVNIEALEINQAGIDELVSFVRDVKAEQEGEEEVSLTVFIDLLCASEDPVRLAACDRIREELVP